MLPDRQPRSQIVPSADIGEPEIAALKEVRQLLVVQPEKRQDGGVQVVHVHLVFGGMQPDFVGRTDDLAALDAAAGKPYGEPVRIMIAPAGALARAVAVAAVGERRPAEIAA